MLHHSINLKCPGSSIMPIILRHVPPGNQHISKYPQGKHCCHANAKDQRPMDTAAGLLLVVVFFFLIRCPFCLCRWWAVMDNVLFISASDNLRCCLCCGVADSAFWHLWW